MHVPLKGRLALAAFAVCSALGAGHFALRYRGIARDIERWAQATPLEMAVDFSQPDQWSVTGVFSCAAACPHGLTLRLQTATNGAWRALSREETENLDLTCAISDLTGRRLYECLLSDPTAAETPDPDGNELLRLNYVSVETSIMTLAVAAPLPSLEGVPQRLIGKHRICETEHRALAAAAILSITCGALAVIFAVLAALAFRSRPARASA